MLHGNRGTGSGDLAVQALGGGVVLLTNVAAVPQGTLSLLADGSGSQIDLSSLTSIDNATGRVASVTEAAAGERSRHLN